MSAPASPSPAYRPIVLRAESVRLALLWLAGFSSAFVFIEPSPYEIILCLGMVIIGLMGLTIPVRLFPFIALLFFYFLGASTTLVPVLHKEDTLIWTLVGIFLGVTAIFYASVVLDNTRARLDALLAGYVACALVASIVGMLGLAEIIPGYDTFTHNTGRLRATFKDANVFGPFLVLPILLMILQVYERGLTAVRSLVIFLVLSVALFLTFSRGAWGNLAASAMLMTAMTFAMSRSLKERGRIIAFTIFGVLLVAAALLALLSIDSVAQMFADRAELVKPYDEGRMGRFGRHVLGFELALDKPLGIGMLQFSRYFPEDTHNSYLNAFMSYGWLGGIVWPTLVLSTALVGALGLRFETPWRRSFVAVYATFLAHVVEAWIIDIDHWRHAWLLFGLVWGLAIASRVEAGRARTRPAFLRASAEP